MTPFETFRADCLADGLVHEVVVEVANSQCIGPLKRQLREIAKSNPTIVAGETFPATWRMTVETEERLTQAPCFDPATGSWSAAHRQSYHDAYIFFESAVAASFARLSL